MGILLAKWALRRHADLTLKSSICNTKPTGATRFPPHALQFLKLLEFVNNIPSAISAKSLVVKPVKDFFSKKMNLQGLAGDIAIYSSVVGKHLL
jgi:hypothetical protein